MLTGGTAHFESGSWIKRENILRVSCILVNEAYLRVCGAVNNKLGSSKTFVCPNCKSRFDRDINAARNSSLDI